MMSDTPIQDNALKIMKFVMANTPSPADGITATLLAIAMLHEAHKNKGSNDEDAAEHFKQSILEFLGTFTVIEEVHKYDLQ